MHGDDFTFSGVKAELLKMRSTMEAWYDIKNRGMMGSDVDDIKKVTILGRTLRWTEDGLEYEADIGHRRKVMEAEGLDDDSNKAPGPAVKEDVGKAEFDEKEFDNLEHKDFRSRGATLNYRGQDRSDIQYAVKGICQGMSKPTEGGNAKIKGLPGTWWARGG